LFITRETVVFDNPDNFATSYMVGIYLSLHH
jgi:hypothetical protein